MIDLLRNIDIKDKKVIVRVDYNVPVENGKIVNTNRIDASFETLDYLIKNNCKVILLSHFGRVKTEDDKKNNSLKIVFDYIKSLNKYDILYSEVVMGDMLTTMARTMKEKQIILVENTRFLDIGQNLESSCDIQLSMYWASLAEYYVDDAFGTMHRNHASVTGIPKFLPSCIGFLAEKEIKNLNILIENTPRPFVVVMGGAKLNDKIKLIDSLCQSCDYILTGGGIANTFLKALGYEVGSSNVSNDAVILAQQLLEKYPSKIKVPCDVITSPSYSETNYDLKDINNVVPDDVIGDIGRKTLENYTNILKSANTIFINGTVGIYEKLQFSNGTNELLNNIALMDCTKIVGGGDAGTAIKKFNLIDKMSFVSTGGGATLSFIADKSLPGIDAIKSSNEKNIY